MMEKRNIGMMEYWEELVLISLLSTHYSIVPTIHCSVISSSFMLPSIIKR